VAVKESGTFPAGRTIGNGERNNPDGLDDPPREWEQGFQPVMHTLIDVPKPGTIVPEMGTFSQPESITSLVFPRKKIELACIRGSIAMRTRLNVVRWCVAHSLLLTALGVIGLICGCGRNPGKQSVSVDMEDYGPEEVRFWTADFDLDRSMELIVLHDTEQGSEIRLFDFDHNESKHYDLGLLMGFPCESSSVAPFIFDADTSSEGYDFRMGVVYPDENGVQIKQLDARSLCSQAPGFLKETVDPFRDEMAMLPGNYIWTGQQCFIWLDFIPGGETEQINLYKDGRLILWENENPDGLSETVLDSIELQGERHHQRLLIDRLDSTVITITGACLNDDEYPDLVLVKDDMTAEVYFNDGHGVMIPENSEDILSLPDTPPIAYMDFEACAESLTEEVAKQVYFGEYPGVINTRASLYEATEENQDAENPMSEIVQSIPFIGRGDPDNSDYIIHDIDLNQNGINDAIAQFVLKSSTDVGIDTIVVIAMTEEDGSYTIFWQQQPDMSLDRKVWEGYCVGDYVENDSREDVAIVQINENDDTWKLQLYGNYESGFRECLSVEVSSFSSYAPSQVSTTLYEDFDASRENPRSSCRLSIPQGLLYSLNDNYPSDFESCRFSLDIGQHSIHFEGPDPNRTPYLIPFENPDEL